MALEKRYQVFVSSTYEDLQDERREVMQALLELDCIPSGMELFPAANEDQWTLIKKVIDDCDYYLVVIAGRYGSLGPDGLSYTEMEYRYALEKNKPIIAFVHKDIGKLPSERTEQDARKAKLMQFRELVQKKAVRYWFSPAELGSVVSRSVVQLTKTHPGIGWVRANLVPDESANAEILKLKREIEELNEQLRTSTTQQPPGTESLAQGDDEIDVRFSYVTSHVFQDTEHQGIATLTWNQIFARISPSLIEEATEHGISRRTNELITDVAYVEITNEHTGADRVADFTVLREDLETIIIQFRALGLIARSIRNRSVKDTSTYWTLTPYGDLVMTRLRAISRLSEPAAAAEAEAAPAKGD